MKKSSEQNNQNIEEIKPTKLQEIQSLALTLAMVFAPMIPAVGTQFAFNNSYKTTEQLKVLSTFDEPSDDGGNFYFVKVQKSIDKNDTEDISINDQTYNTIKKTRNQKQHCITAKLHGFNFLFIRRGMENQQESKCEF